MNPKILFLMPEFPSHTHTWLWREICGLRKFGLTVHLASTRPPKPSEKATHAFVDEIKGQIFYAWPPKMIDLPTFLAWCLLHPQRVTKCVNYARALNRDNGKPLRENLILMLPAWRISRWCRRLGVSHLHVATPANSLIIAQLAGIMADMTCDTTINAKLEWWGGAMHEKLSRCSAVFPVADWMRNQIAREFPDVLPRTIVARHGVDTSTWKPTDHIATVDGPFHIVSVGRLHPGKGHDDLLRAVQILVNDGRNVSLQIAGGGPDHDRLKQMIIELDISKHARLLGPLQEAEVQELLRTSDLFVLASHSEALGVVFMEAMAIGVPVISTRTDGAQEIIEDGLTGLLVGIQSPQEIAQAIDSLLNNPALRTQMTTNGLRRARERFDSQIGAEIVANQIKIFLTQQNTC